MIRLFLAGDVMLGRGIDQILSHPGDPQLVEDFIQSAIDYVQLAERIHGPIPRGQSLAYVWGEARAVLMAEKPDVGIINLETAVTDAGRPEPKGINYRMAPQNAERLTSLGVDCCVLANNHVLDWGREGLDQTLDVLHRIPLATAGAGRDLKEAKAPAIIPTPHGRVLVFGFAATDCGVPRHWAATPEIPGVHLVDLADRRTFAEIAAAVAHARQAGDIAVASIHWGPNWGYDIPEAHADFAHRLIDSAMIDLVHGHSSHHAKGWEIYRGRLILYGCGDFLNDYEGIAGYEQYRGDLSLVYLPTLDPSRGRALAALKLIPLQIRKFSLHRAAASDTGWLCRLMNGQSRSPGARFVEDGDGALVLHQDADRGASQPA